AGDSACKVDPVNRLKLNSINCVRGGRRYRLRAQGDFCAIASTLMASCRTRSGQEQTIAVMPPARAHGDMMNMTAVALSSFLPMWQHRLEAVLALLRGEPGQQVTERFRMARSDLYKFRARALQAVRQALCDQPRGPKRPHNRLSAEREQVVVKDLNQHPTWSARQLHEHMGDEAPHPRTIDRIRQR